MAVADQSKANPPLLTLLAAISIGSVLSMKMMASGLAFVGLFLALWLPYSLVVIARNPQKRAMQASKIGIWLLMVTTVLAIHFIRREHARAYADAMVQKIQAFHQSQGRYPDSLQEMAIDQEQFQSWLGLAHYSNQPQFFYPDTMMIFQSWSYDFDKHQWIAMND